MCAIKDTTIDVPVNDTDYDYKPMCIACEKSVATKTNDTLCNHCWWDAEGRPE